MNSSTVFIFVALMLVLIGGVLIGADLATKGTDHELEIEQSRIACLLAVDDDQEEQACLPPSYGSDW